jgi:hypothetical protein
MDFLYWKKQILSAKDASKDYLSKGKEALELYSKTDLNYNLFYSNVQILDSHLCLNNPKPDIQKRFIKRIESDKKRSNLYSEVSRIVQSAVEYVVDNANVNDVIKKNVHDSNVIGRGVAWVNYEPIISIDETGVEYISDRKITVDFLDYKDYLESTADKESDIWWKARRHLLTFSDIKERFGYEPHESELHYKQDDETSAKRGEVWEIWDKSSKQRGFILLSSIKQELLEVQPDPYKIYDFFPCADLTWIREAGKMLPVAEVFVYKKKLDLLEVVNKKIAQISDELKYVTVVGSQDKSTADKLTSAKNGDVIGIPSENVSGSVDSAITIMPADRAVQILESLQVMKERIKTDIFEITGISDIMRGATDARETASAQVIKGLFGTLRFQERQKAVNQFRKKIYRIIAEIVCEHFDAETLEQITSTYLPTEEEKMSLQIKIESQGGQADQQMIDEYNRMLFLPSWEQVLMLLRNDRLRSYTIDVETTATAFDDREAQAQSINALTQTYLALVQNVNTLPSPDLIKGFLPIMKLNLGTIKASTEIGCQLEDAIESTYRKIEQAFKKPVPPTPEQIKAQADARKIEAEIAMTQQKIASERAEIELKSRELDIRQQDIDRKEVELQMQYDLKQKEIYEGVDINTNISGDVASLE